MSPQAIDGLVLAVTALISTLAGVLGARAAHRRNRSPSGVEEDAEAVRTAAIDDVLRWFQEDNDHESLPGMVRGLQDGQARIEAKTDQQAADLRTHLQEEEALGRATGDRLGRIEGRLDALLDLARNDR